MIPSFRHMGGKARLRKWLVQHFPDKGLFYIEPFAGKGNVFYEAVHKLQFQYWELNDLDCRFLNALVTADLDLLPDSVTKQDFPEWKCRAEAGDPLALLIEPRVTYAGKGYAYGYSGHSGTHVGYSGANYRKVCKTARDLLSMTKKGYDHFIKQRSWNETLELVDSSCFVYLDPPYYNTNASYPNIDHFALVDYLNRADFDWALSGYRNDMYDARLRFTCQFEIERNSEIKSSNSRRREPVIETLWTNYEL